VLCPPTALFYLILFLYSLSSLNSSVALRFLRNQEKMLVFIPLVNTLNFIVHLLA
jgi:hypothetical protein